MAKQSTPPTLFVISDGRGVTCAQVTKAAALQFEGQNYRLRRRSNVRTAKQVRRIVDQAAEHHAIIFYTLVAEETRKEMRDCCSEKLVPAVDVLGPAFSALHDLFKAARGSRPGLLYASERDLFDQQDAIDYTLKHDDGQRPHDLHLADVVIVGVSRAAKSSTCFHLASAGIRAANVPLVPGLPISTQLLKLDARKVVGLQVNVMRLQTVREARAMLLGLSPEDAYVDRRAIAHEVLEANRRMEENGWESFDASYMAVEEIAREVIRLRGLKGASRR